MPSSKASANTDASTVCDTTDHVENDSQTATVTLDRRSKDERRAGDANASDEGMMENPRRKKQRRRHIDPTTCERDYSGDEIEFMRAMDDYKRDSGRMFPTCSEVLEVIRSLGYVRLTDEEAEILNITDMVDECNEMMDEYTSEELEDSLDD